MLESLASSLIYYGILLWGTQPTFLSTAFHYKTTQHTANLTRLVNPVGSIITYADFFQAKVTKRLFFPHQPRAGLFKKKFGGQRKLCLAGIA